MMMVGQSRQHAQHNGTSSVRDVTILEAINPGYDVAPIAGRAVDSWRQLGGLIVRRHQRSPGWTGRTTGHPKAPTAP